MPDPIDGIEPDDDLDPDLDGDFDDEGGEPSGYNPSWDEAWADVPEPIREAQKPVFEKWDTGYKHLEAKFRPYQQFEEQGISPDVIQTALNMQAALLENPREFWERVGEHMGFTAAQSRKFAQDQMDEQDDLTPEEQLAREVEELRQWREQQEQRFVMQQEQQRRAQEEQFYVQSVQSELSDLRGRFGDFDEERVIERALANAIRGGNPSVENAFFEVRQAAQRQAPTRRAPQVLGGGGGSAPAPQSAKPMTPDEQREAARALAARLAGQAG